MNRPRKSILAIVAILGVAVAAYALWLYLTHFYYDAGPYSLGCRNETADTVLRNVSVRLKPYGEMGSGILSPGNAKWFMDLHWPVPTNVSMSFTDPQGATHSLSTTGAPPKFLGKICVVITKSNVYAAHLELEKRK